MVGPKCHVLHVVRTVVIFRVVIFNSSYTTDFRFILVPTRLLISVSVYNTFDFLPWRARLSCACRCDRQHWCMPNFYSLINAQWTSDWCKFARLCRHHPVITKIKYMYIITRVCTMIVNVSVIIIPSIFSSTLILIPTQLIYRYFLLATFKSRERTH